MAFALPVNDFHSDIASALSYWKPAKNVATLEPFTKTEQQMIQHRLKL